MGIPRFFRLISEQFPTVAQQTSFKQGFSLPDREGQQVDNLYLDANGILHNCAHEIYFPSEPVKPRLSRQKPKTHTTTLSPAELELKLFQAITAYMDQLLKFVKPNKLFYIAIDGPAPFAKQAQQRSRRYKSAQEKTVEDLKIFDSTAITPGTLFMSKLSKYLNFYIRKMITTDPIWRKIKVIFSGSNVAGEGEHKIVQYIRDDPTRDELVHCMYGLDADLFMLGLGTHCPKFYLLREDQFNTKWDDTLFYVVDLGLLGNEIFDYWGGVGGNKFRLIDDFLFVCFMVGNDFLHALPACHDLVESINFVMDLRKETLESSYLTNSSTSFSLNNLAILLAEIATIESQLVLEQFYKQNFPNITLNNSLIDPRHPEQGIDIKKYREHYYKKAGIDHTNKHQVWNFCKQYVQGLEWVHYYYHNWPKNWQWYFPYHYSPLAVDLVEYLTNASSGGRLTRVSNRELPPILPFQQLLCVVPPKSKDLLPDYLQCVYDYSSLSKYYPDTFRTDLEGKVREWEAIALLPFIKLEDIIIAYKYAIKKAQNKKVSTKYVRNVPGKEIKFWLSRKQYTYKSNYGAITACNTGFKYLS